MGSKLQNINWDNENCVNKEQSWTFLDYVWNMLIIMTYINLPYLVVNSYWIFIKYFRLVQIYFCARVIQNAEYFYWCMTFLIDIQVTHPITRTWLMFSVMVTVCYFRTITKISGAVCPNLYTKPIILFVSNNREYCNYHHVDLWTFISFFNKSCFTIQLIQCSVLLLGEFHDWTHTIRTFSRCTY